MRLVRTTLHNFRAYATPTEIEIDDLTVILGQNDSGKSSILDALNMFFNEPKGLPDNDDFNVPANAETISISCVFEDLPESVVIDEVTPTTLAEEYMLNSDGLLEIKKVFPRRGKTRVYAVAKHPHHASCDDVLTLTNAKLKLAAQGLGIDLATIDKRINTQLRRAIWGACDDLQLGPTEIELAKESARAVWDKLRPQLPVFALFKSDRASTDQDGEAQDPMKSAIKEAIATQEAQLEEIRQTVENQVQEIADKTVEKIREMAPDLANQLNPRVVTNKWDTLFNVSLTGDEDIPINKRGSGTRRLVLLNFFRAKAEQESTDRGTGIIYAIEEPETSQHPNNQKLLIDAFDELVGGGTCQVLLTTHTPVLARRFNRQQLRILTKTNGGIEVSKGLDDGALERIVVTLGILPDHDIKVFVGVEGKNDIHFLATVSRILADAGEDVPDLGKAEEDGRLVFIPSGGSNVELWIARFKHLNIPEYHIFDRDNPPGMDPHYQVQAEQINAQPNATAVHTSKRELENYLHPSVIVAKLPAYAGPDAVGNTHDHADIPELVATARNCKSRRAKHWINTELVADMTPDLLDEVDRTNELRGWLAAVGHILRG